MANEVILAVLLFFIVAGGGFCTYFYIINPLLKKKRTDKYSEKVIEVWKEANEKYPISECEKDAEKRRLREQFLINSNLPLDKVLKDVIKKEEEKNVKQNFKQTKTKTISITGRGDGTEHGTINEQRFEPSIRRSEGTGHSDRQFGETIYADGTREPRESSEEGTGTVEDGRGERVGTTGKDERKENENGTVEERTGTEKTATTTTRKRRKFNFRRIRRTKPEH